MGKIRKIRIGDFVQYAGKEYIVVKKNKVNYRLVRRQVKTGQPIVVPRKRVKQADQTWRKQLQRGDPLQLFLGGQWIDAAVYSRRGKTLLVQPSLSNFTMSVKESAGIIAKGNHSYPLWEEDIVTPVVIDGECHIERARGLTFPWTYTSESATRIEVSGPLRTPLTTLTFPFYETSGIPLKLYKYLTKAEIMHEIYSNKKDHPEVLVDIATQWCYSRLPIYPFLRHHYGLRFYITQALAHGDQRRVQEMLSVGENSSVFHKSEWTIRDHLSHPYIDADINVVNKTLQVKLFNSGIKIDQTGERVKKILEHISQPLVYAPKRISVDAAPELQYILSRMLGMEQTPVELLSTRKVNGSKILINLDRGFCEPEMKICGGQLDVNCISFPSLVKELMKRNPMRTLVIVEPDALPMWEGFNIYYGRNKGFEPITVTTKALFSRIARRQSYFDNAERLIVLVDTNWNSAFAKVARNFRCKIKWAIAPKDVNSFIFHSQHLNNDLNIELSKWDMIQMGVEFPSITSTDVIFKIEKDSYEGFVKRYHKIVPCYPGASTQPSYKRINTIRGAEKLSLFLEHPELVPLWCRGDKLEAVEATLGKISEKFGVEKQLLDDRTQETCAICLEKITEASVTQCGHVFCSECMNELHSRQINCPMCRQKITSFLKLSDKDTMGRIAMHNGDPYRIPEKETWGKKIEYLEKNKDATFIVKDRDLKRKLKKKFRKTQILTVEDLKQHNTPVSSKIIAVNPTKLDHHNLGLPWGKDIQLIQLKYHAKDAPFGREFY